MNVDGSGSTVSSLFGHGVDVAKDGKSWAFTTATTWESAPLDSYGGLAVVPAESSFASAGAIPKLIASGTRLPRWSPDGQYICFVRADGIYVVSRAGGSETRVVAATVVTGLDW